MTDRRMTALALAASLGLGAAPSHAAPAAIVGGDYDNTLILAVAPGGRVTGYFNMVQEGPPHIDCTIYFVGKLAGASASITTVDFNGVSNTGPITGRLASTGPGKLRITLPQEPDGCGMIWSFANKDDPADFQRGEVEPWTSVRVVKAARAYFSPSPGAPHGRAYIVQYDGVGVRAEKNGWVQADFIGGEKHNASGWLKESDLYPP